VQWVMKDKSLFTTRVRIRCKRWLDIRNMQGEIRAETAGDYSDSTEGMAPSERGAHTGSGTLAVSPNAGGHPWCKKGSESVGKGEGKVAAKRSPKF